MSNSAVEQTDFGSARGLTWLQRTSRLQSTSSVLVETHSSRLHCNTAPLTGPLMRLGTVNSLTLVLLQLARDLAPYSLPRSLWACHTFHTGCTD